ncbi:MAG TPA: MmcQ/YjbR family DNA-binding protein [Gammaproteobacteria bacterium]|nr:MmcQ/YjbR family DNA-binding protein [Gammaproteobacteria bacterium]
MAKKRTSLDFDTVREIALALPGVEQSTTSRGTSFKVAGRMLACPAIHKSAEPGSLVVVVNAQERERLLTTEPDTYYLTPHYVGYPSILVRLSRVSADSLRDLLSSAAQQISERKHKSRAKRR